MLICLLASSPSPSGTRRAAAAMATTLPLVSAIAEENNNDDDDDEENEEGENINKKGATKAAEKKKSAKKLDKKDKFEFDFSGPWVSEDLFAVPATSKRGGDVTCMTSAALEKEAAAGALGELFLPPDAKLQTSDLCRLMTCTNIIVPPPMLAHAFIKQVNSAAAAASSSSRAQRGGSGRAGLYASAQGPDVIWGQVTHACMPRTHVAHPHSTPNLIKYPPSPSPHSSNISPHPRSLGAQGGGTPGRVICR